MAKQTWVNVNNQWRKVKNIWVNIGGVWKQKAIPKGFVSGAWRELASYYDEFMFIVYRNDPTVSESYLLIIGSKGEIRESIRTSVINSGGYIHPIPRRILNRRLYMGAFDGISQYYDYDSNSIKSITGNGVNRGLLYVDDEGYIITGTSDLSYPTLSRYTPTGGRVFSQQTVNTANGRISFVTTDATGDIYFSNNETRSVVKYKKEDGSTIWTVSPFNSNFMHFIEWTGQYIFVGNYRQDGWAGGEFHGLKRIIPSSGAASDVEVKYGGKSYTPTGFAIDKQRNVFICYNSQILEKRNYTANTVLWQKVITGIESITITPNDFIYARLTGGRIAKYDLEGNQIWVKTVLNSTQIFLGAPMANTET